MSTPLDNWRWVPVEATEEMLAAGDKIMDCDPQWVRRGYMAMLAAAPHPPIAQPQAAGWRPIDPDKLAADLVQALFDVSRETRWGPAWRIAFMHGKFMDEHMGGGFGKEPLRAFFARQLHALLPPLPEPQAAGWADVVEQRLLTWRTRMMNEDGDHPALDDFMDQESIDDLIDCVCAPIPEPLRIRALEELAQLGYTVRDDLLYPPADGLREALEAYQYDAMRFRWLTEDHADPETRAKCRELLRRMAVMSYSAACADIDSAMAQADKAKEPQ